MNDKGKGKVVKAASPPSPASSDDFSLSKKLAMLSKGKGKGKSKEQDEPLPGIFLPVFPGIHLTYLPHSRIYQIQPLPHVRHLL